MNVKDFCRDFYSFYKENWDYFIAIVVGTFLGAWLAYWTTH